MGLQKNISLVVMASVWTCCLDPDDDPIWRDILGLIAEVAGFLLRTLDQHQDPPAGIEVRDGLYYNV